jgi:hypothetical protein
MTQPRPTSTAAIGWITFAGGLMLLLGLWWIVAGIAGIAKDDVFVVSSKYVFKFSVTTWGWIHLLLGILVLLAGLALFQGAVWARTVAAILAGVSALIAFAWLPAYPFWGIIFVTASVFVMWAVTVHGRDIRVD